MKARAKFKKGAVEVKLLAKHPMNSGLKKGKAKYITMITAMSNGKDVFQMDTSAGISKDPYLKFYFKGAVKGDKVELKWVDNTGETKTSSVKIK
jgi:sulfur-oxidizing protein SoxZ